MAAAGAGEQDGELHLHRSLGELELGKSPTDNSDTDICPVCRSSRYLNQSMRFLVNPECYHKMCESCVDRIFSHGPHRCPIAGCTRTLRRHRFREQTFGDIQVEREVDVRKRIAAIFNRREDEFETLRDYNDYLNNVEDITFNLIEGIDVEETEDKLKAYQAANSSTINQNAAAAKRENENFAARQAAERERARLNREAARLSDLEERRARLEGRQDIIDQLATAAGDAEQIAQRGQRVNAQRRTDLRESALRSESQLDGTKPGAPVSNGSAGFVIKGLKAVGAASKEEAFDPFGGLALQQYYYTLQNDYPWDWLSNAKKDPVILAGGYSTAEFYSRAMCDAFSGLGVFIGADSKMDAIMVDTN